MRKKDKMIFSVYCAVGVVLIGAGFFMKNEYYSTLMVSMGFGLLFSTLMQIYRIYRDSRPENIEKTKERQRQRQIDLNDERKIQLRSKAGYLVWFGTMMGCFLASFIAAVLQADSMIVLGLFAAAAVQYIAATVIYQYLCGKC